MQQPLAAWHQRKSRDRNLDIFDKALLRFEQRQRVAGGSDTQQRSRQQRRHEHPAPSYQASSVSAGSRHSLGGVDETAEDSDMSRYQYSRSSVVTNNSGGGTGLPRRNHSIGSDVWGRFGGGGGGLQRHEVFRRSFRQAPVSVGTRQSFYSHSSSGGAGAAFVPRPESSMMLASSAAGHASGAKNFRITETTAASSAKKPSAAYFSEGLVISPGSRDAAAQHQQHLEQQFQHESTGSVERELLGYRQQDNSATSRQQVRQISDAAPESVHSEGFLIQRHSIGKWDTGGRDEHSRESMREHLQKTSRQQQQYSEQYQQHNSDYPVLRVRHPYKMNFLMSKEAPAAYSSGGGTDTVRQQFASELYNNRQASHGRQSVMGYGDGGAANSYYHQQVVYNNNQRGQSPRAFAPYSAATAQTQTTLTRTSKGQGTIKEATLQKQQTTEKSSVREEELDAALSRLDLQDNTSQNREEASKTTTTKTTTKMTNQRAEAAAAASSKNHHQSTVSRVSVQNEQREEEAAYFMDGERLRKRVKRRRYLDGKLVDEKEEVESLTEEERKQVGSQRHQWQWSSGSASNGQPVVVTSSGERRPKKRACACCYPRHRRYKKTHSSATETAWTSRQDSAGATVVTETTTTVADGQRRGKKKSRGCCGGGGRKKSQSRTEYRQQQQNGRARQVAFDEQSVYN